MAALVMAALAAGLVGAAPGGGAMAQVIPPDAPASAEDDALWRLAQGRGTADAYRNYLSTFPNGAFAAQARARLGQLQAGSAPVAGSPLPPVQQPASTTAPASPAPAQQAPAPAPAPAAASLPAAPPEAVQAEAALALTLEDRRAIQSRLTLLGHDTRGIEGTFGSGTRRAIAAWQTGRGLAPTGYLTAAQAQELKTAPAPAAPPTTTTPATGATAGTEAALGLSATEKRIIQSRLTQLGHDTRGIDGAFGPGSRRAITAWQAANNLPATGFLSRADADALLNAGTTPAGRVLTEEEQAQRAEAALNLTREDRTVVQRALVAAGHDTRGVDGTFGSGSRRAIRDWQAARGVPATGYLTAEQVRLLKGEASAASPPVPATPAAPVVAGPGASAEDEAGLGLTELARVEVQARLSALGYEPNGVDGRFGPGTRRAISAWQGDNGLAATGFLNADQLARLRAQRGR
ncbi:peptidoglycan-binding domain-containing protein [Paracoccus sp. (in: a-proteobacteria)]|uniref:peptidoglycan-binding domain-containing protein n=1 Tax=Paracoccus sp. TaxID=267 RepID=UPI0026DF0807|nr:peptidoglycan-binding domain-containing protein [Paracoccus sp. (in: a-proteobacteria)]MDO5371196.1 peptidoglycan-binding domain-containing protein [Paracoccus sp. (in: a-proteobacteria)]